MDTRQWALDCIATMRGKVDKLLELDINVVLGVVMGNWREYELHKDTYKYGPMDTASAFQAIREAMAACDALEELQDRLDRMRESIHITHSLHEPQELTVSDSGQR